MSTQIPLWVAVVGAGIALAFGIVLGVLTQGALTASSRRPPKR